MRAPQVRGALLEEVVLFLLELVGYRVIEPGDEGTCDNGSGLVVRGRGEWHQVDALAAFDHTPAFMYPLRLLVEAKCYAGRRPVGIEVPRNTLGILRDISENYFSYALNMDEEIQMQRFNYHAAIFSTSGYTYPAQRYAVAHQIFLIDYHDVSLMRPIADLLLHIHQDEIDLLPSNIQLRDIRSAFRESIRHADTAYLPGSIPELFHAIRNALQEIRGSYFGMLQGRFPMHLLSNQPLPASLFAEKDEVLCRVMTRNGRWGFEPINDNSAELFRLEFSLPLEIARVLNEVSNHFELARVKQERFSRLYLSGVIGEVRRSVVLKLDEGWLRQYLEFFY